MKKYVLVDYHLAELRIAGSRMKVVCRLYETQRAMLEGVRRFEIAGIANDTLAYCATQRSLMPPGTAAIVYFCRPHLSRGTIAHELDHAAFAIMARRRTRAIPCTTEQAPREEEAHAYLLGDLIDAFHKRLGI
jgi:hypothetical protein